MLHKHAATIRPYPLPTRQHAAARPNSRQIRQMSAIPANPPFHSQLAARPNNRRHHQPTATHPQTTSTPNLSQTLMISRQTLTRAPLRQRRPPPIPKIPKNPANPAPYEPSTRVRVDPSPPRPPGKSSAQSRPPRKKGVTGPVTLRPTVLLRAHPQYPMTSADTSGVTIHVPTIHWCLLKTKNSKTKTKPHLPPPSQSSTISPIRPKPSRRTPICRFALSL